MTQDNPGPPPTLFQLLRAGSRWWMWALIAAVGLAFVALVALQAIEYIAPFFYVAI